MKYCPYCGATLVDSAAPFCAECGKSLPAAVKPAPTVRDKPVARPRPPDRHQPPSSAGRPRPPGSRKPAKPAPWPPGSVKSFFAPKKPARRRPEPERRPKPDPRDDGYDGYYRDVKPMDNGHTRDRTDPELVKRVIIIAAGAFVLVLFSVILMYLL
jgi:hypothetical protein